MRGAWRSFLRGPATDAAIRFGHRLILALGSTWRIRHVGAEHVERARFGEGPVLYAFPHGALLPLSFTHRDRNVRILVSESRDGEIITRITRKLGFDAVRGSSSRGGERAVIRMCALAREGLDLAITPDGPRGPRGSVGRGVLLVAARAGLPIVPVGVAARAAWRARSWDRFLVPLPFALVWVVYGPALRIPDAGEGTAARERVHAAIVDAERQAWSCAAGVAPATGVRRVPA